MKATHIIIGLLAVIAAVLVYAVLVMPKAPMSEYDWMVAHPPSWSTSKDVKDALDKLPDHGASRKDTLHREGAP